MHVQIIRRWFTTVSTIGELFCGDFSGFTLEDRVRAPGVKVPGETCIPAGSYRFWIFDSPHFGRKVLRLLDVPMFEDIEMHPGNTSTDTRGCILPGLGRGENYVTSSRLALDAVIARVQPATGDQWIVIIDQPDDVEAYQRLLAA